MRERYSAQDFPPSYIIDHQAADEPSTKTARERTAGNPLADRDREQQRSEPAQTTK